MRAHLLQMFQIKFLNVCLYVWAFVGGFVCLSNIGIVYTGLYRAYYPLIKNEHVIKVIFFQVWIVFFETTYSYFCIWMQNKKHHYLYWKLGQLMALNLLSYNIILIFDIFGFEFEILAKLINICKCGWYLTTCPYLWFSARKKEDFGTSSVNWNKSSPHQSLLL